jgi:hypothetical protein
MNYGAQGLFPDRQKTTNYPIVALVYECWATQTEGVRSGRRRIGRSANPPVDSRCESSFLACRDAGSCCDLYKTEPTALGAEHTQQGARSSTHQLEGPAHVERNYDQRCRGINPFAPTYQ